MRLRIATLIVVTISAGLAAVAWCVRQADPAQLAVAQYLPPVVGVDSNYPKLGFVLRSRCWLLSGPSQPEGVSLFVGLSDAIYETERVITEHEVRPSFDLIAGKTWEAKRNGWVGPDGTFVSLAQLREHLEAACLDPGDARLILDLLVGQPAQAASNLIERLRRGDLPALFHIRPFSGKRGLMLSDLGHAPYKETERGYKGLVLGLEGAGWPTTWRIGSLRAVGF